MNYAHRLRTAQKMPSDRAAMESSCRGADATFQPEPYYKPDAVSTLLPIAAPDACTDKTRRFFVDGMVFAFAGRFEVEHGALKRKVEKGGCIYATSATLKVTYVITTMNLQEFRLGAAIVERQDRCVARPEASSVSVSVLYPRESALEKGGSAV